MGIGAAMFGGILGDLLNYEVNAWDRWEQNNKMTTASLQEYMKNVDLKNSMEMLEAQQAYNTKMSNTAYQRAVEDMKAAGLNPALMYNSGGAAASPTASAQYHPGSVHTASGGLFNFASTNSMVNSAINAAISKDKNIANIMAAEIVDNAKHAHRIEEMREKHQLSKADRLAKQDEAYSKANYYTEKAGAISDYRFNRKYK